MPFILMLMMSVMSFAQSHSRGEVYISPDFCACQDRMPVSYGNCSAFCKDKDTQGAEILYINFKLVENPHYTNVREWCLKTLPEDTANPECALTFKDENGSEIQTDVTFIGKDSITADVSALKYDKTYVFQMKEVTSGKQSNAAQMIKMESYHPHIPLKISSMTEFACISKSEEKKFRFYFKPAHAPMARNQNSLYICHDVIQHGPEDSDLIPRLDQKRSVFGLWEGNQPLFFDNNGNGVMDVHDLIVKKVKRYGGEISPQHTFFHPVILPGSDVHYQEAGVTPYTGNYFMSYWLDTATYKSHCLTKKHYDSMNPVFQAMRDVLGIETEGLYAGVRTKDLNDIILLREADIKMVWFHVRDGVRNFPTDENVANVTVYFYYPLNKSTPFIKHPGQELYRVRSGQEIGDFPQQTNFPSHDRKLGCIPKF